MALSDDSSFLAYDVFSDSDRSASWTNEEASGVAYTASGSAQTMPVYGKIAAGQTGATQGSYADVLVVTVNY
jgi:spore coat protein U-like protein